ncbi:MAG: hypothetical protein SFU98_05735 [Leptospiraceae bacterium]|nr:hypothetical protein [Leptospiraceae bacterium]
MKYLVILLLFNFALFAQTNVKTDQTKKDSEKKEPAKLQNTQSSASDPFEDLDLDKEFYVYYNYLNQPKSDPKEDNKVLHTNLIKSFKNEIILRDTPNCNKFLPDISVTTVRIKNVSKDSVWMKKIKKEVGYINFTEFMYIVKFQTYLALIIYEVDPKKHNISPQQVELIISKDIPVKEKE